MITKLRGVDDTPIDMTPGALTANAFEVPTATPIVIDAPLASVRTMFAAPAATPEIVIVPVAGLTPVMLTDAVAAAVLLLETTYGAVPPLTR